MKKLIFSNPGKKFPSFMQPHVQLPCSRQPVLSQINPVDTFAFCFSKIRFNIILPSRSRCPNGVWVTLRFPHHSPVCVSLSWARLIQSTPSLSVSLKSALILFYNLGLGLPNGVWVTLRFPHHSPVCVSLSWARLIHSTNSLSVSLNSVSILS